MHRGRKLDALVFIAPVVDARLMAVPGKARIRAVLPRLAQRDDILRAAPLVERDVKFAGELPIFTLLAPLDAIPQFLRSASGVFLVALDQRPRPRWPIGRNGQFRVRDIARCRGLPKTVLRPRA